MKFLSFMLLFAVSACSAPQTETGSPEPTASATHEIYLVRHAEKQGGDDPSLTPDGTARAVLLAELLADKGLTRIHSTNYKRTLETAAPIAALTGLEVELYDASDLKAFAEVLKSDPGVHLVVGHSNTTPGLSEALGGDPGTPIYEATEYDRLYVINLEGDTPTSRIDRFGMRYETE